MRTHNRQNRITTLLPAVIILLLVAAAAPGQQNFDVTMTADNAYAIYYGDEFSATVQLGWAENTTPTMIWSTESYSLTIPDNSWIYIAAWSDDKVKQGVLADFTNLTIGGQVVSGNTPWEVTATGVDLDNASPPPSLALMTTEILDANAGTNPSLGWVTPTASPLDNLAGGIHGVTIGTIDDDARWMWYDSGADTTSANPPFTVPYSGFEHDEFLIFRIPVEAPEPMTMAVLGVGGLGLLARRRRRASAVGKPNRT